MYKIILVCFFLNVCHCPSVRNANNACPTFYDYSTLKTNKKCWYNSDVDSQPYTIAKNHGYRLTKHEVTTEDGYILTLNRLSSLKDYSNNKKQPVLLHHGLGAAAVFWILDFKNSLAFFLVNNGYDVWMANARGTRYSRKHTYLEMNDPAYWNFSFHEVAINDLPAYIDFIANRTEQKGNLIYIGHSMGSTISYIYSILNKTHAEKNLAGIVSLAPVAYMKNVMGLFRLAPLTPHVTWIFRTIFGMHAFPEEGLIKDSIKSTCSGYPLIVLCNWLLMFTGGIAVDQMQPEVLPVFLSLYPTPVSFNLLEHFSQLIVSGRFQQYDYGMDKNMIKYNSSVPPEYEVENISLPIHLFVGSKDFIADEADVDILFNKLNSNNGSTRVWKYVLDFAHNDFFLGKTVKSLQEALLQAMKTMLGKI